MLLKCHHALLLNNLKFPLIWYLILLEQLTLMNFKEVIYIYMCVCVCVHVYVCVCMPICVYSTTSHLYWLRLLEPYIRGCLFTGMVVNGFVNVVITTIERRFGLRSSQSGLVAGGYDIASFACLIPVTYLGGRPGASKPRWLGWGVLLMGIGSLVFTIPHFAVGPYRGATHHSSTCQISADASTEPVCINI